MEHTRIHIDIGMKDIKTLILPLTITGYSIDNGFSDLLVRYTEKLLNTGWIKKVSYIRFDENTEKRYFNPEGYEQIMVLGKEI